MSVVGLLDKYTDAHKRIPNVGVDLMVLGITLHSVHFVPLSFSCSCTLLCLSAPKEFALIS